MASIQKRNEKYRVVIRKKGFDSIVETFDSLTEAEIFAKETEESLEKSKWEQEVPLLPMKIWIERFKQEHLHLRSEKTRALIFLDFWENSIGQEIAAKISSTYIENVAGQLRQKKTRLNTNFSDETIRKYIVFLSVIYKIAMKEWKWCLSNPCECIRLKKQTRAPTSKSTFLQENYFRKDLTDKLKQKIKEMQLPQSKISKMSGLSKSSVQAVLAEDGNPTIQNLMKVLSVLGLELHMKNIIN